MKILTRFWPLPSIQKEENVKMPKLLKKIKIIRIIYFFLKCFANIPSHPVYKKCVTNKRKEMYRWVPTYQHNRIKNKKHY